MKLEELDGAALTELIRSETRGIVVDVWSPWCAPCRALKPHLVKLAEERAHDWRFVAVNADEYPDAAEVLGVTALPTLVWFKNGRELTRLTGGVTLSGVAETLDAHQS